VAVELIGMFGVVVCCVFALVLVLKLFYVVAVACACVGVLACNVVVWCMFAVVVLMV